MLIEAPGASPGTRAEGSPELRQTLASRRAARVPRLAPGAWMLAEPVANTIVPDVWFSGVEFLSLDDRFSFNLAVDVVDRQTHGR